MRGRGPAQGSGMARAIEEGGHGATGGHDAVGAGAGRCVAACRSAHSLLLLTASPAPSDSSSHTLAPANPGPHRRTFTAGASLYGVADLRLLAEHTHKFESRWGPGLCQAPGLRRGPVRVCAAQPLRVQHRALRKPLPRAQRPSRLGLGNVKGGRAAAVPHRTAVSRLSGTPRGRHPPPTPYTSTCGSPSPPFQVPGPAGGPPGLPAGGVPAALPPGARTGHGGASHILPGAAARSHTVWHSSKPEAFVVDG